MPLNAVGQQGSWFARYKGVQYPCVHNRYMNWKVQRYCDADPDQRIPSAYVEAIISRGRVLVTESNPDGSRHHYKGLLEVGNVQWENGTLSFDVVKRLE